jgi:hypothetical protein
MLQLGQRAQRGFLDARDGAVGCAAQADRDRDGLFVVEQQWRQRGAGP